jgi:anti-sigma factor RsiW
MNCDELEPLLLEFVSGELVIAVRETVEVHVTGCPHCEALLISYRHTVRVAAALPKCAALPAALEARLRKALADQAEGEGRE